MGSQQFYPDEGPVHEACVAPFAIERHPVTNAQFSEFIAETGYLTVAERPLEPRLFPDLAPSDLDPGALVFTPTPGPVDLSDWRQWWRWSVGADWRHPFGPESSIDEKPDHPVVQVAYADAEAYATWAGRRLPSEAEWEYAARAGSTTTYAWGEEAKPGGQLMANTWQGYFPYLNTGAAGWIGTSPVGLFPANDFGISDMIGNVWEWTSDWYDRNYYEAAPEKNPQGPDKGRYRVLRGGSWFDTPDTFLTCAYRSWARQTERSPTIGFRCAKSFPGIRGRSTSAR